MRNYGACLSFLPHRYPFLLLDRIIQLEPGQEIIALKRVSSADEFANEATSRLGSFPFSLIAEAMAQAASVVATSASMGEEPPRGVYAAINQLSIIREPRVGEELWLKMKLLHQFGRLFEFRGEARIGGELIGEGQVVFRIP